MHPSKRLMWLMVLAVVVTLTAACGGQPAEEAPAAEPAPAEEATPAVETAPVPEPEPEQAPEPAAPQLQGEIVEIEETADFDWLNAATREIPGKYYWVVELRNDTTQVLDITVIFQFLNADDGIIKTDRKTVRLQPASNGTFRVEDEMQRDDANAVENYTYYWDWAIVSGQ
jgi:hypothetical protein